jgi:hypothetical protein
MHNAYAEPTSLNHPWAQNVSLFIIVLIWQSEPPWAIRFVLSPQWGHVKQLEHCQDHLASSGKRRVGVVDMTITLPEDTVTWHVTGIPILTLRVSFFLCPEIQQGAGRSRIINCGVEVLIEVRSMTRIPRKRPSRLRPISLQLLRWCTRDAYKIGVLEAKMPHVWKGLGRERTSTAASVLFWREHEVVDYKLFLVVKQV